MRIGQVIGKVTLSKWHPSVQGGTWLLAEPLTPAGLAGDPTGRDEALVVYDELGAGLSALISFCEGAEASAPFHPQQKPLDAYCAAILDSFELFPTV